MKADAGEPRGDLGRADFDNDYQVIRLSISWGATSVAVFLSILALHVFGRVLGVSLGQVIDATRVLSLVGLLVGLIGQGVGRGRGAAKVGAFLNGVVLGLLLIIPVVFQILRRLG